MENNKSKEKIRILGIDPGVATTGWAIVEFFKDERQIVNFGVISTSKDLLLPERLLEIDDDLENILNEFKPVCVGIEELLFYNNAKTAISVGESRGVVLTRIARHKLPIYEFTPLEVKNIITGYGQANKKQVQENIKRIFKLEELPRPDDAADAVAIALCTYNSWHARITDIL